MCRVDIIVIGLLACAVLKCWEILAAINWLRRRGDRYRSLVASGRQAPSDTTAWLCSAAAISCLLASKICVCVASRPLRAAVGEGAARRLAAGFQRLLFPLPRLNLVAATTCLIAATVETTSGGRAFVLSPMTPARLMVALSVLLLACVILLAVEAIFSLTILGGYAVPFQKLHAERSAGRSVRLLELKTFGRVCVNVVVASTTWVFVSASLLGSFVGLGRLAHVTVSRLTDQLVGSVYFVVTTFATVGYGDIHPDRVEGQVLASTIIVATFVVAALRLAVVTIAISSSGSGSSA
jgi:hypothetical protein